MLRPLNQNQLLNGGISRERSGKHCFNSPLVPKINLQYPTIKCTAHFKRSYIELDDEMISVITDVEGIYFCIYVTFIVLVSFNMMLLIKIKRHKCTYVLQTKKQEDT